MNERAKALQIQGLDYAYRSNWAYRKIQVLHGISLDVFEGESFGFLGHNGAGKTTSIKCILNLVRPSAGEVTIFGINNRNIHARRSVGYLPEQPYFYDYLTVSEIMEMYATLAGVAAGERRAAIQAALESVKISARSKSPMRSLSKGLTQRVAMAQAIVAKPRLLILDEPFSGLDPIGRKEFKDLLFDLKSRGTTIFMSSHILGDVEFLCDRVSIMAQGHLKGVFAVKDIPHISGSHYELVVRDCSSELKRTLEAICSTTVQQGKFLLLNFTERARAEEALKLAVAAQGLIESYGTVDGGLEELFVQLVNFEEAGRR